MTQSYEAVLAVMYWMHQFVNSSPILHSIPKRNPDSHMPRPLGKAKKQENTISMCIVCSALSSIRISRIWTLYFNRHIFLCVCMYGKAFCILALASWCQYKTWHQMLENHQEQLVDGSGSFHSSIKHTVQFIPWPQGFRQPRMFCRWIHPFQYAQWPITDNPYILLYILKHEPTSNQ